MAQMLGEMSVDIPADLVLRFAQIEGQFVGSDLSHRRGVKQKSKEPGEAKYYFFHGSDGYGGRNHLIRFQSAVLME